MKQKLIECHKLLHNGFHSDPDLSNECKVKNELQTNQRRKSDDETLKNMFSLIMDKKMDHDEKSKLKIKSFGQLFRNYFLKKKVLKFDF